MTRWRDWLSRSPQAAPSDSPWAGMSAEALLAAWDAGRPVWTCKMADLGPGYEQTIQEIGMVLLRAMLAEPFDYSRFAAREARAAYEFWLAYVGAIMTRPDVRAQIDRFQPEALQIDAAMNVAGMFARNGYEAEMNKVPEDRRIMLSRRPRQTEP